MRILTTRLLRSVSWGEENEWAIGAAIPRNSIPTYARLEQRHLLVHKVTQRHSVVKELRVLEMADKDAGNE